MFIVLAFLLLIVTLAAVAYPIFARGRASESGVTSDQEALEELTGQRDAAFQALRELNFDHQVGKIGDEDFVAFEANLKQSAADRLRDLDSWEAEMDRELGPELERAIAAHAAELRISARPCPACGRLSSAEDKFCAGCGAALPVLAAPKPAAAPLACANCGKPFEPGDRFCAGCGQPLPELAAATAV